MKKISTLITALVAAFLTAPSAFALDIAPDPITAAGGNGFLFILGVVIIAAGVVVYLIKKRR